MAGYRNGGDLFEEEMERLKRKEKEIQDEVYQERLAEKKQKYDEIANWSSSRSRDSSHRSRPTYKSYDIVQELEEERQRKRQLAEELETRERQIQKTSELLERQSKLLASFEANTMRQNQSSMTSLIDKSQPSMPNEKGQSQPSIPNVMGQCQPSIPSLMGQCQPSIPNLMGQRQPSLPSLMVQCQPSIPSLMGQCEPSMPTLMGHNPQSMPTLMGHNPQSMPSLMGQGQPSIPSLMGQPSMPNLMGQGQPSMYNQLTTSVYRQSVRTDYQYPLMNPVAVSDPVHPPYNPPVGPLPVTGIVEEPVCKKAKTAQTGVSEIESNTTGKCRYCKTFGHRMDQCPKLVEKRQRSKLVVCYYCYTVGHYCKDCPGMMKSRNCFRCNSLEHQVKFCPEMKKSKKAQETETVNMDEVDSITYISVTPDTQNNITPSCGDARMNSSFSPTVSSSATTSATSVQRSTALNVSGLLVGTSATTVKSETPKLSKKERKRKRKALSISSSVNNQEQTSCVTSKKLIDSTSAHVTSNLTKSISPVPSTNISNTYNVTATKTTVTSSASKPIESTTDFDIAEEIEKFKTNPKHMMSLAKYRRHIENLRKAERDKKKSIVPTQTEEKIDSFSNKVSVKQENTSSSPSQTPTMLPLNSYVTQNTRPVKESIKEEDKPKSFACDACQFTCYIKSEINTHKQTPLHIKKTEKCENGCKMCGKVKFKTFAEYTSHNSQKLHKTLLQKKKQMCNTEVAKIANQVAGGEYVVAGFFCKLCKKFYDEESYAQLDHCKSKEHHEKLVDVLSSKYDPVIHLRVLQIYKAVKKDVKEKKVPENLLKLLLKTDFSNLIPVASAKLSDVSKDSNLTQRFLEIVKEVEANDIFDAGDSELKISEGIKIDPDRATAKACDTCIKIETSVKEDEYTRKSASAETGNRYDTGSNQASRDVAKNEDSKIDIGRELEINNDTSLKSFNVNSVQVSSQIKYSFSEEEGNRLLEAGGSSKYTPRCISSTPESLTSKKKPKNPLVLPEKMESIDPVTDLLLADNGTDDILCGDCDSDIDFSD